LACTVSHGGCVHHAFEPGWIEEAQWGEYPFELAETLAYAFGRNTFDEWVEYAPQLSLLRKGILDQPCADILVVNGRHDSVFPISDCYLLLEHGMPKSARFFDASHMGYTPATERIIVDWIASRLQTQGGNQP
jgi:esterase FrsA